MTEPIPPEVIGEEFGFERIKKPITTLPPIYSRDLVSDEHYSIGSEYGGVAGLIQPVPHVPTASERLSMIYAIDPMDDGSRPDSVVAPELEGDFT